jgi:hypothetical protein
MKTSVFIALITLAFFALSPLKAADKTVKKPAEAKGQTFSETKIKSGFVMAKCRELAEKLESGTWCYGDITGIESVYKNYAEHPDIEKETKIRKEWFLKLAKFAEKLAQNYINLDAAIADNLPELAKKSEKEKQLLIHEFKKTFENPPKIKSGKG